VQNFFGEDKKTLDFLKAADIFKHIKLLFLMPIASTNQQKRTRP
jgi:hypothetical protein